MFWLFDDIIRSREDIHKNYQGSHPYYKTIYGKKAGNLINLATSISLLYPKVYFIPVDTKYPESESYFSEFKYEHKEYGFTTDFSWVQEAHDQFRIIPELQQNPIIQKILSKVPRQSVDLVLQNAIIESYISKKEQVPIYASFSHMKILNEIAIYMKNKANIAVSSNKKLEIVLKTYGVSYNINKSSSYLELRTNKDLIKYGSILRRSLEGSNFTETEILENILNIYESQKNRENIDGVLKIAGYSLGLLGLIPVLGTVSGVASLAKDAISDTSALLKEKKNAMYNFTAELDKSLTIERIKNRLNEIKNA